MANAIRTTSGRGRLFDSVLDTIGDTPTIRVNNLGPDHVTLYVKAEAFNPGASVKDRSRAASSSRAPRAIPASALRWSAHRRVIRSS